jgi:preprotein translocase subunit SecE
MNGSKWPNNKKIVIMTKTLSFLIIVFLFFGFINYLYEGKITTC